MVHYCHTTWEGAQKVSTQVSCFREAASIPQLSEALLSAEVLYVVKQYPC